MINIKKSVISLSKTYELYLNVLSIINDDNEIILIRDKDLEDLKEFLKST